jgi:hypothetical protein
LQQLSLSEAEMLTGGCHCGAVRYEATSHAYDMTNCHCTICRRTTGAPFVAWFSVPLSSFRFAKGAPAHYHSSNKATRGFCARCGAQLTFFVDGANEIDVTTATLDDPNQLPPRDHIQTATKLSWVKLADGLPEFRNARADG